jgi:hypothetical protein
VRGGLAGILQFHAPAEGVGSRMSRLEMRQNSMARDIDVLKADVKALAQKVEHFDERFDQVAEAFDALRAYMDRRFDQIDRNHAARQLST